MEAKRKLACVKKNKGRVKNEGVNGEAVERGRLIVSCGKQQATGSELEDLMMIGWRVCYIGITYQVSTFSQLVT